jgi:hypothetical protein
LTKEITAENYVSEPPAGNALGDGA